MPLLAEGLGCQELIVGATILQGVQSRERECGLSCGSASTVLDNGRRPSE